MMMQAVCLLMAIAGPVALAQCGSLNLVCDQTCPTKLHNLRDNVGANWVACNCEEDGLFIPSELVENCECAAAWNLVTGTSMDIPSLSGADPVADDLPVSDNKPRFHECIDCPRIITLAKEKDNVCCEEMVELLLEETFRPLDSDHHGHHIPNEDCIECAALRRLAYNTGCHLNKHNTCYLYGRPRKDNGYGSNNNDYLKDSYYAEGGAYGPGYTFDANYDGYYSEYNECTPETIGYYYGMLSPSGAHDPHGDGTEKNCPVCTGKYTDAQYESALHKADVCRQEYADYSNKYPIYNDAADTSVTTTESTDKTVETVGWVLIALSGVLFLASIAFFLTGRSERKAAAENRMAGHGVMA